jgi:hypothetical protein
MKKELNKISAAIEVLLDQRSECYFEKNKENDKANKLIDAGMKALASLLALSNQKKTTAERN